MQIHLVGIGREFPGVIRLHADGRLVQSKRMVTQRGFLQRSHFVDNVGLAGIPFRPSAIRPVTFDPDRQLRFERFDVVDVQQILNDLVLVLRRFFRVRIVRDEFLNRYGRVDVTE